MQRRSEETVSVGIFLVCMLERDYKRHPPENFHIVILVLVMRLDSLPKNHILLSVLLSTQCEYHRRTRPNPPITIILIIDLGSKALCGAGDG